MTGGDIPDNGEERGVPDETGAEEPLSERAKFRPNPKDIPLNPEGHRVHCPNCQRYIGPVARCPYCDFKVPRKTSWAVLKWGSLAWGVVGLLLVWGMFAAMPNPEVKIGDLGAEHNYGRLVLTGTVVRTLNYYPDEAKPYGSTYFTIDDGTGEITCICYSETTQDMVENGKIPAFGDRVTVEGTYQFRDYRYTFIVDAASHITIYRDEPYLTTVRELDNALGDQQLEGNRVQLEGEVAWWDVYDWAISIYITDGHDNYANIYVPNYIWELTGKGDIFKIDVGTRVNVTGALTWYEAGRYSRWEVIPAQSSDFVIVPEVSS